VKSLATWSCRSGSSASKVARDGIGIGEPDGELPDEEPEEEPEEEEEEEAEEEEEGTWLEPGDSGANASAGRWRL